MIYVMSDIHGNAIRFNSIMEQIDLQPEDTLYILGDVIDRYPDGIRILRLLMSMPNVQMLLGNHEYMMLNALDRLAKDNPEYPHALRLWYRNGGDITHEYIKHIRKCVRKEIFDYLHSLPLNIDIEINEADCRVDTYRASGAGGQHINKTDSAVRITHIPTGIVVQCQNQRSQFQNREAAWKMLKARLYELELKKREEAEQTMRDNQSDIGWGHQIRSYVLQPYKMVKDLRTEVETSDTKAVLDGDIDMFLSAALAQKL